MGHEYIHVYFNAGGISLNTLSQDKAAYQWNIDQAKEWKLRIDYEKLFRPYDRSMKPDLNYNQAGFTIHDKRPWKN